MNTVCTDLQVGRETKLCERFMGKHVYAKLIDFGALPGADSEKSVRHGITDLDQFGIDNSRSFVDQGNGSRHALFYPNTVPNAFWRAKMTDTDVCIHSGQDRSSFSAVICVWYTKASEMAGTDDAGCACCEGQNPPAGSARIRLNSNLTVYVNGDRAESGDGLTPEAAVKSYEDAVEVISRYDGCNRFAAIVHFATLGGGRKYPRVDVFKSHSALFRWLYLEGDAYDKTSFDAIMVNPGSVIVVRNLQFGYIWSLGWVKLEGKISTHGPSFSGFGIFCATDHGVLDITAQLYINGSGVAHMSCFCATNSGDIVVKRSVTMLNTLTVTGGFAYSYGTSQIAVRDASFSGPVTGRRYHATVCSFIYTEGKSATFLPGTTAGSVAYGGVYY